VVDDPTFPGSTAPSGSSGSRTPPWRPGGRERWPLRPTRERTMVAMRVWFISRPANAPAILLRSACGVKRRPSKSASDQRRVDGEVAKLRDGERRSRSQRQSRRGDDEGDHDPGGDRREAHSRPVAALDEIAQQERRADHQDARRGHEAGQHRDETRTQLRPMASMTMRNSTSPPATTR